jgi:L-histidine Nalpha-methyltransferase
VTDENLQDLTDIAPEQAVMLKDVLDGLAAEQKAIPSLYFYDDRGSALFEQITEVPEYYPTRTEVAIMEAAGAEIGEALGPGVRLIELGSGSSMKTGALLRSLPSPAAYIPVEISQEHLLAAAERIAGEFPGLEVLPVCADFSEPMDLPQGRTEFVRDIAYFPGSTIGNFPRSMAADLLALMSKELGPKGGMLIGVDLKKAPEKVVPAYDDAQGVTAQFNLNLLIRLNRELGADFDLEGFTHRAVWDEAGSRMQMHLVSRRSQTVTINDHRFDFQPGEHILTEYSHKYSLEAFAALANANGFKVEQVWTDPEKMFSVQYLTVA